MDRKKSVSAAGMSSPTLLTSSSPSSPSSLSSPSSQTTLQKLILDLIRIPRNTPRCNIPRLLSALQELDTLVGMSKLKDSVSSQVKFLITTEPGATMLHTVLYGPPGTGKTTIGKILCKIWSSVGYLTPVGSANTLKVPVPNSSRVSYLAKSALEKCTRNKTDLRNFRRTVGPFMESNENLVKEWNTCMIRLSIATSEIHEITDLVSGSTQSAPDSLQSFIDPVVGLGSYENCPDCFPDSFDGSDSVDGSDSPDYSFDTDSDSTESESEPIMQLLPSLGEYTTLSRPLNALSSPFVPLRIPNLPPLNQESTLFKVVSRKDFVAEYVGHTALKTSKLLEDSIGKVLFIDESYSLVQDEQDWFGKEALTVLNQFMSERPKDLIVIFAGYKSLMQESIFREQPGLQRRCTWCFEVSDYTASELSDIFRVQLKDSRVNCSVSASDLESFFGEHSEKFPGFGGDTQKLLFYANLKLSEDNFDRIVKSQPVESVLTLKHLRSAVDSLTTNQSVQDEEYNPSKRMMYC